ncbi:serine hydrolase domain-containing protein [Parerythrobacter lacustris]|uniref:Beta-lactamase family protein n=1 Tax=Parerythrobacter lacustris TaxID=2969984 RepID=A0ABT1XU00_9SPHN|nr:beta-lactamase family protein [Parerythrobacter lacustris]
MSQTLLEALQEVSGVPGLSAAVWQDGAVVWTGAAGRQDVEGGVPVTRDTRFRLASVSKLLTVTAVARLAEEGRIDLDAPIASILPWLDNDWPPISARQLAAHTSGLPHYQEIDADRGKVHYPDGKTAVEVFAGRPLLSAPGDRYSYSAWGYTLLGAMVEEVTGEPFTAYLAREIAPGLDLGPDATDSGDPHVSIAYEFLEGSARRAAPHDYSYTWGGGGMMGTAESLVRFGGAMMDHRVVTKATFDDMLRPAFLSSGEVAGEDGYSVGFGWRSAKGGDGSPIVFHNGVTIGARSSLVLWHEEKTAAAILSNASWTSSIDATSQMLAAPFRSEPEGLVAAACPIGAASFEGTLAGEQVSGWARFRVMDGLCQGEIELAGSLHAYFDRGPQPTAPTIRVVGLDPAGGLSRAGMVTPFGLYELRASEDGTYTSRWSVQRVLELRFIDGGDRE